MLIVLDDFLKQNECQEWRETIDESLDALEMPGLNVARNMSCLSTKVDDLLKRRGLSYNCNSIWYLTRYEPGMGLGIHQDGTVSTKNDGRSCGTILMYVSDEFHDGELIVYESHAGKERIKISPKCGTAIIVGSRVWHSAAPPIGGCKHLLRSDVTIR